MKPEYAQFLTNAPKQEQPPTRATCPACKREFTLCSDGTVWRHRARRIGERWGAGSGKKAQ